MGFNVWLNPISISIYEQGIKGLDFHKHFKETSLTTHTENDS